MNKLHTIPVINTSSGKWLLAAALSVSLLAGCGSGGGDGNGNGNGNGNGGGQGAPVSDISKNVGDLIAYMKGMLGMDENGEVVDINPLTLAVDNAGDPAPL